MIKLEQDFFRRFLI